jgi:hypothetical protein
MIALLSFLLAVLTSPFRSKSKLVAENALLRHQVLVLRRKVKGRVSLTNGDRCFFVQLYRWFPSILSGLAAIQPETLIRWHRTGFRLYWRWKSRPRGGRPQIEADLRALIRRMSIENPLWGAPRIHGELLKLGFEVAQSSVAKYMVKRRGSPSQGWRTFLCNHAPDIAAMDLFVVPTIGFDLLYAFVVVRLDCRALVWINVTASPSAELGCAPDHRSISLERGSALPDPRSGWHLRHNRNSAIARHGYPRHAHRPSVALAEWLCRAVDRIDPTRMPRPCDRTGRGASAPDPAILCSLRQNAPVIE